MAKELVFSIGGNLYGSAPVKLERKKLYGWSTIVATDKQNMACISAYLSPDDALLIPSGAYKQGTVDDEGRWVEKSELKACDSESGKELQTVASSFDAPITLRETVPAEVFLDHEWDSVYQLANTDLADAVGDNIYIFPFSYRGGSTCNDGFLMRTEAGLFLFSGSKLDYPMITLAEETVIDDFEDDVEEDIDELDFSMM